MRDFSKVDRNKAGYTEKQSCFLDASERIIEEYVQKEMLFEPATEKSYKKLQDGLEKKIRDNLDMDGIESLYARFFDNGNPAQKVEGKVYVKFTDSQYHNVMNIILETGTEKF